jgi:hypothetical protein
MSRWQRARRALFGDRPALIAVWFAPTITAWVLDFCIRAHAIGDYDWLDRVNYFGSSLASAGFWGGPLWLCSRLFLVDGPRRRLARAGLAAFFALFVLPLAVFSYGGQALYHAVFHAYMSRDTLRLGIALRGTVLEWIDAWGGSRAVLAMLVPGVLMAVALFGMARAAAPSFARTLPVVPWFGFVASSTAFWSDFVESRALQAAPPDTCFIHGVVHALHDGVLGKGWVRRGISLRSPAPLPPLDVPAHRPNVLFIVTESVRADATCSDPPPLCASPLLDPVAAARLPLGKLTTQSSGTFSACMMLWTGLDPTADFRTAHQAPVLWEVARALGYRTYYVTSQNLRYDDFAAFTRVAGIDRALSAMELGGTIDAQIGAPDERAVERLLSLIREGDASRPWFAVLHYSNTHAAYRSDPALSPYQPESSDPLGDVAKFKNHYLNSVRLQERTTAELLSAVKAMPGWKDTAVVYVSDHGETFREHGGLYHLNSLFDEQVRIPGWLLVGDDVLDARQREMLTSYAAERTYSRDVHATMLDLLGVFDARARMPFAAELRGRSLLRRASLDMPIVPLSTKTGVWEPDVTVYGIMHGEKLLVATPASPWQCFDTRRDPRQIRPFVGGACGQAMLDAAHASFPGLVPEH